MFINSRMSIISSRVLICLLFICGFNVLGGYKIYTSCLLTQKKILINKLYLIENSNPKFNIEKTKQFSIHQTFLHNFLKFNQDIQTFTPLFETIRKSTQWINRFKFNTIQAVESWIDKLKSISFKFRENLKPLSSIDSVSLQTPSNDSILQDNNHQKYDLEFANRKKLERTLQEIGERKLMKKALETFQISPNQSIDNFQPSSFIDPINSVNSPIESTETIESIYTVQQLEPKDSDISLPIIPCDQSLSISPEITFNNLPENISSEISNKIPNNLNASNREYIDLQINTTLISKDLNISNNFTSSHTIPSSILTEHKRNAPNFVWKTNIPNPNLPNFIHNKALPNYGLMLNNLMINNLVLKNLPPLSFNLSQSIDINQVALIGTSGLISYGITRLGFQSIDFIYQQILNALNLEEEDWLKQIKSYGLLFELTISVYLTNIIQNNLKKNFPQLLHSTTKKTSN